MALVDIQDLYLAANGRQVRWMRGTPVPIQPGPPTQVQATVTGTTLTVTWQPPIDNGGTPVSSYTTTMLTPAGASHTLLSPTATSDTFTVTAGLASYRVGVQAVNTAGVGSSSSAVFVPSGGGTGTIKFPGYPNPKVTGKWYLGGDEADKNPRVVTSPEVAAPEVLAGSGHSEAGIRYYYKAWSVMAVPSGQWLTDLKLQYASGRFMWGSIAVAGTGENFATASDGRHDALIDAFIAWCEETAPNILIPISFSHEPNYTGAAAGSTAADFGHFMRYFRSRMDVYANAHGGVGVYQWKRISFGPIHTAQDYAKTTSPGYVQTGWDASAKVIATSTSATNLFTANGHLLSNGRRVNLIAPPTGYSTTTLYHVVGATANTFQLSLTHGGAPVTMGSNASGITVVSKDVFDWMGCDPYISRNGTISPFWTTNWAACVAWCEDPAHTYPIGIAEFAIYNRDPTAATKLQQFMDKCLDGTHDVWCGLYYNSGDQSWAATDPLFTQFILDNVSNGNLLDKYVALLRDPRSAHPWDFGFTRPPGV